MVAYHFPSLFANALTLLSEMYVPFTEQGLIDLRCSFSFIYLFFFSWMDFAFYPAIWAE